jgi:hypothetical protein
MKNSCYEECLAQTRDDNLNNTHKEMLTKIGIPSWSIQKCPYCKEDMSETSIRSISIKLNPRNIGDICVEFLCHKCKAGNSFYFTKSVMSMNDFIDLLKGTNKPISEPIIEEEMYKQKYHNTIEYMMRSKEI